MISKCAIFERKKIPGSCCSATRAGLGVQFFYFNPSRKLFLQIDL
jgi:hypothetical protein